MYSVKLSSKFLAVILAAFPILSYAAPQFTVLEPVGDVAVIPHGGSSTGAEYYYQIANGSIVYDVISGPFNSGSSTDAHAYATIPATASPPLYGTPIAAVGTPTYGHIFYYGPDYLLSEYYWSSVGWQGGPDCAICIQQAGFFGVNGSQVLYTWLDGAENVRVGFISTGNPQTLSEAIMPTSGGWSVAGAPNA